LNTISKLNIDTHLNTDPHLECKDLTIPREMTKSPAPADMLKLVETTLEDDKADNTVVIPLAGKTEIADYLVITNGTSNRHVTSMADHLRKDLKAAGVKGIAAEGLGQGDWVLIDAGDIIIHLFRPEVRDFYNLDKIWLSPETGTGDAENMP